jgi:hypothetical protein
MGENTKLEYIIKQLSELKGIPDKINDVITRFDNFNAEITTWKRGVEESLENAHKEIADLKTKCANVVKRAEFEQLRKDFRNENLKARIHSYKQNLIFCGLNGVEQAKWETEQLLRDFWVNCLGIPEEIAYTISLLDCHRMKSDSNPANIIAKFAQMSDRDYVYSLAKNLKNFKVTSRKGVRQQFFIQHHYPMELQEQKRALMPLSQQAGKAKLSRNFRVVGTELALFINRQRFYPGQQIPQRIPTATHLIFPNSSPTATHLRFPNTSPTATHLRFQNSSPVGTASASESMMEIATESTLSTPSTEIDGESSISTETTMSTPRPPPDKRSRVGVPVLNSPGSPSLLQTNADEH